MSHKANDIIADNIMDSFDGFIKVKPVQTEKTNMNKHFWEWITSGAVQEPPKHKEPNILK